METNVLYQMSEKEEKLAHQMLNKKKDIQLLASNGTQSWAVIDNTMLEVYNLIIGYTNGTEAICVGIYANHPFSYPIDGEQSLIRVWQDCRDLNDIRYYVNYKGEFQELTKDADQQNDKLLILLLECPDFVQFSLYDGSLLNSKASHIFTAIAQIKAKIKTIANSMLNRNFPGLQQHLLQLGEKLNGSN